MTHAPGTFCFAELVSPDVASAKQFYGDLKRTIDQTHGLGGSDDLPIIDIPNVGRCASLLDHRQGLFIVMQPVAK